MKYRTTDKEQRKENYIVVGFGYCSIQNVERLLNANAYTCGVYGWRADFYNFGNVTLSTGYAPLTYGADKRANKIGAIIRNEILKLEKRIASRKTLRGADWHKLNREIVRKIEKIIDKAFDSVPYDEQ